jgi:hypothetical protein
MFSNMSPMPLTDLIVAAGFGLWHSFCRMLSGNIGYLSFVIGGGIFSYA